MPLTYPFFETVSIRVGKYYETTDKHRFSGSVSTFICVHLCSSVVILIVPTCNVTVSFFWVCILLNELVEFI